MRRTYYNHRQIALWASVRQFTKLGFHSKNPRDVFTAEDEQELYQERVERNGDG